MRANALETLADVLVRSGRLPEADQALAQAWALYEQKGNLAATERLRRQAAAASEQGLLRAAPPL
jgi:hypothetical protein